MTSCRRPAATTATSLLDHRDPVRARRRDRVRRARADGPEPQAQPRQPRQRAHPAQLELRRHADRLFRQPHRHEPDQHRRRQVLRGHRRLQQRERYVHAEHQRHDRERREPRVPARPVRRARVRHRPLLQGPRRLAGVPARRLLRRDRQQRRRPHRLPRGSRLHEHVRHRRGHRAPGPELPVCSDGLDNDGDTRIDYPADTGCTSASSNNEGRAESDPILAITAPTTTGTLVGAADDHNPSCVTTNYPDRIYTLDIPMPLQSLTIDTENSGRRHRAVAHGLDVRRAQHHVRRRRRRRRRRLAHHPQLRVPRRVHDRRRLRLGDPRHVRAPTSPA